MQLILCDSCRRVVDPADLDGGRGARMGDKAYCADCVPGGTGRPTDVGSCRDCQVAVVHAALTSGADLEFAEHPICVHCEKNPARTPMQPCDVPCAGCGTAVPIRELRIGIALPMGERAWCGGCRHMVEPVKQTAPRKIGEGAVASGQDPPPRQRSAPEPDAEPAPTPEPSRPRRKRSDPAALACDTCRRPIEPGELRSGHAAVVNGAMVCPRCRGRSARQTAQRRASTRYAASLVFVLVLFPVASAALGILIYRAIVGTDTPVVARNDGQADPPPQRSNGDDPGTQPGAPSPRATTSTDNDELRSLLADLLKALAASERAHTQPVPRAGAASVGDTQRPNVPKRLQPAPDVRPRPGPGAAIAKRLTSDAAKRQLVRLADPDPGVRLDAVLELASLTAEEAAPALRKALADADPLVRSAAAKVCGKLEAGALLDPLVQRLGDPDKSVRRSVAQALGRITKTEKFYLFEDLTDEQLDALRREIDKRRKGKG